MSAHYSTREASGCLGCAVALGVAVGMLGVTAYVCFEFARWLVCDA